MTDEITMPPAFIFYDPATGDITQVDRGIASEPVNAPWPHITAFNPPRTVMATHKVVDGALVLKS